MDLVYLAGPPAAGKSTLMRALTSGCERHPVKNTTVPHQRLIDPVSARIVALELGKARDQFPGTDTLPMNIAPVAKRFITQLARPDVVPVARLVLGEGDRLGFPGFLQAALDAKVTVTLVHVTCSAEELDRRCGERGSAQNMTWRKGRATKAANLAQWAAPHGVRVVKIDSTDSSPVSLAGYLTAQVPALAVLPR